MKLTKIALIMAAASFTVGPAFADEPSYLGMKRGRYVPAPAPVPETFSWYVRLDLGVGITNGGASDHGSYGDGDGGGMFDPFFVAASTQQINWFDPSSDPYFQGGVGFGKYFSPRFRMDLTFDLKTPDDYGGAGTFTYGGPGGSTVSVTGVDRLEVIDGVGLLNAYLDLVPRGYFTPYIGIGAGFAIRSVDRSHQSTEESSMGGLTRTWDGSNKDTQFAPAFSATAGFAWAITPGTMLDINYRYTYIGSVDTSMPIRATDGAVTRSSITIDESHQHTLRAGLRWNIW
jgi:opacity protein-like surface antigen